jgi:hypothetical protein
MADDVTPERIASIAAGAGIPLDAAAAARVARSVTPTVRKFAEAKVILPLEVEPATFVVVAHTRAGGE